MSTKIISNQTEPRILAIPGTVFNIKVTAAESNNSIVVADYVALPGSEPPRHVHSIEDEVFRINEGTVTFFRGDEIIHAEAGDIVFLPKNVPHHFKITSDLVSGTFMATPANIEHFFRSLAAPFEGITIPPVVPPTEEQLNYFVSQTLKFGMQFV